MRKFLGLAISAIFFLSLAGISLADETVDLAAAKRAAESVNSFAFRFYKELSKESSGDIAFSPYSIFMMLAALYTETSGKTQQEIANTLSFTESTYQDVMELRKINKESEIREVHSSPYIGGINHESYRFAPDPRMDAEMEKRIMNAASWPVTSISFGNAMWCNAGFPLRPSFDSIEKNYGVTVYPVDFSNIPQTLHAINSWARRGTKSCFLQSQDKPLANIEGNLILTSVFECKFPWPLLLSEKNTKKDPLYTNETPSPLINLMSGRGRVLYAETQNIQIVGLPGGAAGYGLLLFLPRTTVDIRDMEKSLSWQYVKKTLDLLKVKNVSFLLPKITLSSHYKLKDTLRKVGINKIFEKGVALPCVNQNGHGVFDLFHNAMVMAEEGVKFGSWTSMVTAPSNSGNAKEDKIFRADRPFLYVVLDQLGTVLFIGKYSGR